jgi:hypothetical protein
LSIPILERRKKEKGIRGNIIRLGINDCTVRLNHNVECNRAKKAQIDLDFPSILSHNIVISALASSPSNLWVDMPPVQRSILQAHAHHSSRLPFRRVEAHLLLLLQVR